MKIIQSYWSKPIEESALTGKPAGWLNKSFLYISQAYSCLKYGVFYPVELVTDAKGKEVLIDILELPYSKVYVELDAYNPYPTYLWAIGKLHAYRIQNEPFIHVDNDCFIWEKFSPEVEKAGLVVERLERIKENQTATYNELIRQLTYIPEQVTEFRKTTTDFIQVNAGIFGGNDLSFIREYTGEAFRFINRNLPALEKLAEKGEISFFNMVYEQFFFHVLTGAAGKKVTYFQNQPSDISNLSLSPFENRYVHLFGKVKSYPWFCTQLAQRLWQEYPFYYNRIMKALEKKEI